MSKKSGRNTFAKRSREMDKKRKAQEKLSRRAQRRTDRPTEDVAPAENPEVVE